MLKMPRGDTPLWQREPLFLARNRRGIYYYVDRFMGRFGGKRYRLFVGRRGQVREQPLTNVVEDADGMVFVTKKGSLELNKKRGKILDANWGTKKPTPLKILSLTANNRFIYQDLGVYLGENLGTVCP